MSRRLKQEKDGRLLWIEKNIHLKCAYHFSKSKHDLDCSIFCSACQISGVTKAVKCGLFPNPEFEIGYISE